MTDSLQQATDLHDDRLFAHISRYIGIEDQTLLPQQFFASTSISAPPGEKQIRYRMLRDAVKEFRRYAFATSKRGRKTFAEVYSWVITNDYTWPYSFVNLCEVFSINPEAARAALILWKMKEQDRRDTEAAQTAGTDTSPRSEPGPELHAEGGTDEASEHAEGRGTEQAA
jgi:hypothetical protein